MVHNAAYELPTVFDFVSPALLVIDMQGYYLDPASPCFFGRALDILPNVKGMIGQFRESGRPVVYVRHVQKPERVSSFMLEWYFQKICFPDSYLTQICNEIHPLFHEKVISKEGRSAFVDTDLQTHLESQAIKDIVIAGIASNLCCKETAFDAQRLGYRSIVVADATLSFTEEIHRAALADLSSRGIGIVGADWIVSKIKNSQPMPLSGGKQELECAKLAKGDAKDILQ